MHVLTRRIVATVWFATLFGVATTAAPSIPWETKLDRASAAAQAANQPMLIDFWAAWCGPCQVMDREVYSDARVAAAMAKVRPVKVDVDRDTSVTRKYDITATPTLLVTDSYGRELFRYAGALPRDRMVALLEALPADMTTLNRLSAAVAADKSDFAALRGLGRALRASGFYRTSNDYYDRARRTAEGRRHGGEHATILVEMERNALQLRLYVDAAKLCKEALQDLDGQPAEPAVRLDLGRALLGLHETEDAGRVLRDLLARHPKTPAAAEAARLLAGG